VAQQSIAKITGEIVDLLTPLSSEERGRVITASLALLGETAVIKSYNSKPKEATDAEGGSPLSSKGKLWMKHNAVTAAQLLEVFHFENETAEIIIGAMPGASIKEKVRNFAVGSSEGRARHLKIQDLICFCSTNRDVRFVVGQ
jgi:hypothetical protein